jgi:hypothetical protein
MAPDFFSFFLLFFSFFSFLVSVFVRVFAGRASKQASGGGGLLLLLPQQSRTQIPSLPPKSFRGDSSACFRSPR